MEKHAKQKQTKHKPPTYMSHAEIAHTGTPDPALLHRIHDGTPALQPLRRPSIRTMQ